MSQDKQFKWRFSSIISCFTIIGYTLFWLKLVLTVRSPELHYGDDINFFGPLISQYILTGDESLLLKAQGPHLHFFYKLQTYISMKYFDWNAALSPLLGVLVMAFSAKYLLHRTESCYKDQNDKGTKWSSLKTALPIVLINMAFVTTFMGLMNFRSLDNHILALNNPVTFALSVSCIFYYVKILCDEKKLSSILVFLLVATLYIWLLATALSYFLLIGLFSAAIFISVPDFIRLLRAGRSQKNSLASIVLLWYRKYTMALLAGLYFCLMLVLYSTLTRGNLADDIPSGLSGRFFIDLGVSSLGISEYIESPALYNTAGLGSLFLAIISLSLIFYTKRITSSQKALLCGLMLTLLSLAVGTEFLRGEGAVVSPRYTYFFVMFWVAIIWYLGLTVLPRNSLAEGRISGTLERFLPYYSGVILSFALIFNVVFFSKMLDNSISYKKSYNGRAIVILVQPLKTLTPKDIKIATNCILKETDCYRELLRVRCFAQARNTNICVSDKVRQLERQLPTFE